MSVPARMTTSEAEVCGVDWARETPATSNTRQKRARGLVRMENSSDERSSLPQSESRLQQFRTEPTVTTVSSWGQALGWRDPRYWGSRERDLGVSRSRSRVWGLWRGRHLAVGRRRSKFRPAVSWGR